MQKKIVQKNKRRWAYLSPLFICVSEYVYFLKKHLAIGKRKNQINLTSGAGVTANLVFFVYTMTDLLVQEYVIINIGLSSKILDEKTQKFVIFSLFHRF